MKLFRESQEIYLLKFVMKLKLKKHNFPSTVKSNSLSLILPDNMLIYTALVLAHSNSFKDFSSKKTLNDLERCLTPVIEALMSDLKGFSYNLNKNTLESMKVHKDIHDSDDSNEYSVVSLLLNQIFV